MSDTVSQFVHLKPIHKQHYVGFDMDDTLIYSSAKSYRAFPNGPESIRKLHSEGHNIVVFSNQKKPRQSDKIVQAKVDAVINLYSSVGNPVPILFLCARAEDKYRKPGIGMIDLVPSSYGVLKFFVGDADGSEGSHSDCDAAFAQEAKVPFYTPEKCFNVFPVIGKSELPTNLINSKQNFLTMILLVGYPASGKTTYAKQVLEPKGFHRISRDDLGTMAKCLKQARQLLGSDKDVVIDNLNASQSDRKQWMDLANETGAQTIVIYFSCPMSRAISQNENRERKVPAVVFYTFRKRFELPSLEEKIDNIYSILE